MAEVVPPIPYKTPVTNNSGMITEPWSKWFRQVFQRIGGTVALSNTELTENLDLTDIENDIAALQTLTGGHTTSINTLNDLVDGLLQGRQV